MGTTRRLPIFLLAAACFLSTGCEQPGHSIDYVSIGVDEDEPRPVFGVEIANRSTVAASVASVDVKALDTMIFQVLDDSTLPDKFEHHAELWKTEGGLTIEPGGQLMVPIVFVWDIPSSANLAAVCRATFSIRFKGSAEVKTEQVMFVVGSSPAARKLFMGGLLGSVGNATDLLKRIRSPEVKKSAGVQRVADYLQEKLGV